MINDYIKNDQIELTVRQVSKGGAPFCGDSYYHVTTEDYFLCVLADGLGSGEFAYESSNTVTEIVKQFHDISLEDILDKCNKALASKRGAAVAILKVMFKSQQFQYVSVGNIRFFLFNPLIKKVIYPLPTSGYLSGSMRKFKSQTFTYEPTSRFILYSDGLELKEIKAYMGRTSSINLVSEDIWNSNTAHSDDITFIMGSLLR